MSYTFRRGNGARGLEGGIEIATVREMEIRREDVESGAVGERGWKWVV